MIDDTANEKYEFLGTDRALEATNAIEKDRLHRSGFARQVVNALMPLSARSSLVVSVEGAWGSGKTSILSMVEELLLRGEAKTAPLIVHFNPWLIGDRDALLQQFLSLVSKSVKLADHTATAREVAKEIDGYSKILNLAKYIPGAEPLASIAKSVLDAVGKAASHVGDAEKHNIEERKHRVEEALKKFPRRIIVLVDDIDRLYPKEVFEVIRIIKAVADLPNVGYVLALDPEYTSEALTSLGVPKSHAYLDKVVQTRLSVPMLSTRAKSDLINTGFNQLPKSATADYFPGGRESLAQAYHSGLRDLLVQPRDFVRLFNVTRSLEPELRGEVVLADILALAALSIKATSVYELLRNHPAIFVGHMSNDYSFADKAEGGVHNHSEEREKAYAKCSFPDAVRRLVHFLFPLVEKKDTGHSTGHALLERGRLAHPSRLAVALQSALTGADVSFKSIRKFIDEPLARQEIAMSLTTDKLLRFP